MDDKRIEFLEEEVRILGESVKMMRAEFEVLEKKVGFIFDNNARIAMEQTAIAEAVRHILDVANTVIEQRKEDVHHIQ